MSAESARVSTGAGAVMRLAYTRVANVTNPLRGVARRARHRDPRGSDGTERADVDDARSEEQLDVRLADRQAVPHHRRGGGDDRLQRGLRRGVEGGPTGEGHADPTVWIA